MAAEATIAARVPGAPAAAAEASTAAAAAPSPASRDASAEARREAARLMGSARTEKKRAAVAKVAPINGLKGGRPRLPLSEIPCTCAAGESPDGHRWNCPRGQAIKRRSKAGEP